MSVDYNILVINTITFKLFILNFHPPEVVSRQHDPQLDPQLKKM